MTYRNFKTFSALALALSVSSAHADLLALNLEPIVGYEQVQQVLPTPHRLSRLVYGARATAGILLLSAEAEYTRGVSDESFPDFTQKVTGDRLKVGLRSGFGLGSLFSIFARGGVQASQEKVEQNANGEITTTYQPLVYRPYAGLGARAGLSNKLSVTANVVAVISDVNDMSQNEYQVTAGFAIRLP